MNRMTEYVAWIYFKTGAVQAVTVTAYNRDDAMRRLERNYGDKIIKINLT